MFRTSLILSLSGLSHMVSQSGQIFLPPPLSFLSLYGIRPLPSASPPPCCLFVAGVSGFWVFLFVCLHVFVSCLSVCVFSFPGILQRTNQSIPGGGSKTSLQVGEKNNQSHNNREQVTVSKTHPEGPRPGQYMTPFNIAVLTGAEHITSF